jgi:hypothetical protein
MMIRKIRRFLFLMVSLSGRSDAKASLAAKNCNINYVFSLCRDFSYSHRNPSLYIFSDSKTVSDADGFFRDGFLSCDIQDAAMAERKEFPLSWILCFSPYFDDDNYRSFDWYLLPDYTSAFMCVKETDPKAWPAFSTSSACRRMNIDIEDGLKLFALASALSETPAKEPSL